MVTTRDTLLGRLKADNAHDAWREFYHLYWGAVLRYARKMGLNQHQAEEVLQETMVALMRILPTFVYDRRKGRFRNFLLTIVHRKSLGILRRARCDVLVPWPSEGADGLAASSERIAEEEAEVRWREALIEEVLRRLRLDATLGDNTFDVFRAYVIERQPAAVVAERFALKENAVYQIKNRLLRRVQREIAALMRAGDCG